MDDRPHGAEACPADCRRQISDDPWGARACRRVFHDCWDALVPARILLSVSASLLIADYWHNRPRTAIHPWRWVSGLGALVSLLSFGAGFWSDTFGLFREMVPVRADRLLLQILPMDILRRTVYALARAGQDHQIQYGDGGLSAIRTRSRYIPACQPGFFTSIHQDRQRGEPGGHAVLLWQLPAILLQANFQSISPLWVSLGWGWYLSMLGTALTLLGSFWQNSKPGTLFNSKLLSERKLS